MNLSKMNNYQLWAEARFNNGKDDLIAFFEARKATQNPTSPAYISYQQIIDKLKEIDNLAVKIEFAENNK